MTTKKEKREKREKKEKKEKKEKREREKKKEREGVGSGVHRTLVPEPTTVRRGEGRDRV